jgi:hypothetical protein
VHNNTPITSEYVINILSLPSHSTTIHIILTFNYSLCFSGPFSYIFIRRPCEDLFLELFREHNIQRGLVQILTSNIETANLYLLFSQPPAVYANFLAIEFDGLDQCLANPEPINILIAVSKIKNLSMVHIRCLPNPNKDSKLCLYWDFCDNSGNTIFS